MFSCDWGLSQSRGSNLQLSISVQDNYKLCRFAHIFAYNHSRNGSRFLSPGDAVADQRFVEGSLDVSARPSPIHHHQNLCTEWMVWDLFSCIPRPSTYMSVCACTLTTKVKLLLLCKFHAISVPFHTTKRSPNFWIIMNNCGSLAALSEWLRSCLLHSISILWVWSVYQSFQVPLNNSN